MQRELKSTNSAPSVPEKINAMALKLSNPTNRAVTSRRRGIVLVAVVAVFAISLTLFGVWAQSAVRSQQRIRSQQFRVQAVRLAEAGVWRAIARRAADTSYKEELWHIPAEMLDKRSAAQVRIRVAPVNGAATIRFEATAEFPDGAVRRAQITRRVEIPSPTREDES
jgi:hypothetical protein